MKIIFLILWPFRRIAKFFSDYYGGKVHYVDKNRNEKGDP